MEGPPLENSSENPPGNPPGNPPSAAQLIQEAAAALLAGRPADAVAGYDRALVLKPRHPAIHANRGAALLNLGRLEDALAATETALGLAPHLAEAHIIRGDVLYRLDRFEASAHSFEQALALAPHSAAAHAGLGNALLAVKKVAAAIQSFDAALALKPGLPLIPGQRIIAKLSICDWPGLDADIAAMAQAIEDGSLSSPPFTALALIDSPRRQRLLTERFAATHYPARADLGPIAARPRHDRLRIGYFSADFHDHPVPRLMAEVFERHDRAAVEVTAFSYGPPIADAMRSRLEGAFDRFLDLRTLDEREIARTARQADIDIAVDLTGYTANGRPGIFAFRAAPLQAGYIGYLGSMAAPYYDYLIADPWLIPDRARPHYTESIVYLPWYQANDSQRAIAAHRYTRAELGLPEQGCVFCCFNNTYKIMPDTFASWMRIMRRAEDSALLLFAANKLAAANFAKEAARHGVDPGRVVVCGPLPSPLYMARLRAADLFLDTLPYNAGTTASDALWAGLPVLTRTGEGIAGRMAGSLLTALGLPELICSSQEEYETRAVAFAAEPAARKRLRDTLEQRRATSRLFDASAFTRSLETAYAEMTQRLHGGLPPADIFVH